MIQREVTEIAVIGAGVVGMTCALRLAAEGRAVVLVDPEDAGSGASYGNAGTIADYAVMPVGTPAVLRDLPRLMFDRNSPLAIRHAAILSLAPWLLRFLRQSLPGAAMRNAQALAGLLAGAGPMWSELAAEIGAAKLMQHRGCLYAYETPAQFRAGEADMATRRALGVEVELLNPGQLASLEPGFPAVEGGAAFFPQAIFLSDPVAMMGALAGACARAGIAHLRFRADRLTRLVDGLAIEGKDGAGQGLHLHARRVVIAAGAHGRGLAAQVGDRVPLDTERGYHVEWDMERPRLQRPCCPTSRGFYFCPMTGRLRVAGTVELGGLTAPPSPHRIRKLIAGAQALMPDLGEPSRSWMGFRPSMPDSLPVIGPGRAGDVIHAYGHGHLGVTLAPVTARLVADYLSGRMPERAASPFLPTRF